MNPTHPSDDVEPLPDTGPDLTDPAQLTAALTQLADTATAVVESYRVGVLHHPDPVYFYRNLNAVCEAAVRFIREQTTPPGADSPGSPIVTADEFREANTPPADVAPTTDNQDVPDPPKVKAHAKKPDKNDR